MAADDPAFVVTNVLIYASRPSASEHATAQAMLSRMRQQRGPLWLSHQVLREYLAASTRPQQYGPALPMSAAITDVERFRSNFNVIEDSAAVLERLLALLASNPGGGAQVHDANIVATILVHGITRLFTFNGADFHRFDGLIELVAS